MKPLKTYDGPEIWSAWGDVSPGVFISSSGQVEYRPNDDLHDEVSRFKVEVDRSKRVMVSYWLKHGTPQHFPLHSMILARFGHLVDRQFKPGGHVKHIDKDPTNCHINNLHCPAERGEDDLPSGVYRPDFW